MFILRSLAIGLLALTVAAPAMAQRINFASGIGYYVFYDGTAQFLSFTTGISKKFDDKRVIRIPRHAEFYTFGLDFSHAGPGAPLPPHLVGMGMEYLTKDGKLEGRYMVRFVPVPGYQEKVYRIEVPFLPYLASNNVQYEYFALRLHPGNFGPDQGYLFRFSDDEPKVKELVDALTGKLGAGAALEGELFLRGYGVRSRSMKVILQIDGFEANDGAFNATLKLTTRGKQIAFKGHRISEREIALTRADNRQGAKFHLFLRGNGTLAGEGVPIRDSDGIVSILELLTLSTRVVIDINRAAPK